MKIGFIGLGKLGLPCAEVMAENGHELYGYDVKSYKSEFIKKTFDIEELCRNVDLIFVAVPTPHAEYYDGKYPTSHMAKKDFDYSIVKKTFEKITESKFKGPVVLISTVLPGTIRHELTQHLPKNELIYNPYLIAMGSVKWDFKNPEMIIIGTRDGYTNDTVKKICAVYESCGVDTRVEIGTWEEAESIKIFYNTYISMKISFANMVMDVSNKLGHADVDKITQALSASTKRLISPQYMTAGMGDAGACHPRDNIALSSLAEKLDLGYDLFSGIMTAREQQAKNLARVLVDLAKKHDLPIYVNGLAYKPEVSYTDGSYSYLVIYYCRELGFNNIKTIDPLVEQSSHKIIDEKAVVLLAHNSSVTYNYVQNQSLESNLYSDIPNGSIVVDPWRRFTTTNRNIKVVHYGNSKISS